MQNNTIWHYLPEMPEIGKEVLVAFLWFDIPIQGYWDGEYWRGSTEVITNTPLYYCMGKENVFDKQEDIYAWCELPAKPEVIS